MKQSFLIVLLIAIMLCSLALVNCNDLGTVRADSNVSGIISSDATWTKAHGSYNLTGNVLIDSGVTVKVEADTTLNLDSYYIRVNGTLIIQPGVTINMKTRDAGIQVNGILNARGSTTNPIHINGAYGYYAWIAPPVYSAITFSVSSAGWNEETSQGSIIENAIIDSTNIETSSSITVRNDRITSGQISLLNASPSISNNVITATISIKGGSPTIIGNNISGGGISFYVEDSSDGNVVISDNIISSATGGNSAGIWFGGSWGYGGHLLVERNLITNCYQGIMIFSPNFDDLKTALTVQSNTITNNTIGIMVMNSYVPTIISNNINDNGQNIKLATDYSGHSKDFSAANNWWGTTDTSAIDTSIYDYNDDFNLGKVTYAPFLTAPNPQAMPDPNVPIPTANVQPSPSTNTSPSSTLTPTSESSTQPTQNPTTSPQQSSNQTGIQLGSDWIEIGIIVLLGIIVVLLFINIFYRHSKSK